MILDMMSFNANALGMQHGSAAQFLLGFWWQRHFRMTMGSLFVFKAADAETAHLEQAI